MKKLCFFKDLQKKSLFLNPLNNYNTKKFYFKMPTDLVKFRKIILPFLKNHFLSPRDHISLVLSCKRKSMYESKYETDRKDQYCIC